MSPTVRRLEIDGLRERRDAEALELDVRRLAARLGLTIGNVEVTDAKREPPPAARAASPRRRGWQRKGGTAGG